ncbi:MAG TPA: hypothetical protein VE442_25515 [Jatrophihabitans sp.]|nr:hypothetical protein [Jatrophihabitans sp.]
MIRRFARDDRGQSLIFVMFISVLTMLLIGTATTAVVTQIKPARISLDDAAAYAAAEAGIEDFVAWANDTSNCPAGLTCPKMATVAPHTKTVTGATGGGQTGESFTWSVLNPQEAPSGTVHIKSVGHAYAAAKTLIAAVGATPAFNNFEYYTKYETYSSDFVDSFYGNRNVEITNPTGSWLNGTGVLRWNGSCNSSDPNNPSTCVPRGSSLSQWSTNICDDLYYPNADGPGRGTDDAWYNTSGRRNPTGTLLDTDNSFAFYTESGTYGSANTPVTHTDVCDSTFEPNMVMNGPVYSEDAYLIDRGDDTGSSKNSMPVFNSYAYSLWDGSINGSTATPGPNGGYDRRYPGTDGQISTSMSPTPVYTTRSLDLPPNADDSKTLASCVYTGPTRILLRQNIAYITSPATPAGAGPCYASTGDFATATGGGVVNAAVPIDSSLIYVQNPDTSTHAPATVDNRIFDLKTNLPHADSAGDTLANNGLDAATFSAVKAAVDAIVNSSVADANVQTRLSGAITYSMAPAVVVTSAPTTLDTGDVKYLVTAGGKSSQTSTVVPAAESDQFFQSEQGSGYQKSDSSWTVSITRYSCPSGPCSGKKQPGVTSQQMLAAGSAATRTTYTANAGQVDSTARWPWFGKQPGDPGYDAAKTYTDPDNDITPYYDGWGDAYIAGTLHGNLTVVAEHDIAVTNNTTYSNTDLDTTTDGLALIADHNVRVYRPMTCTDDGASGATSKGWCPNDLTGVYTKTLRWPPAQIPNYPTSKYMLDSAPSLPLTAQQSNKDGQIYATIFTLGGKPGNRTRSTDDGGSFLVDNFYRGDVGTGLSLYGGLYQYHRGPTSLPYQNRPYQGSTTKMPGVTLTYNYDNMRAGRTANGGLRVPWLPPPSGATSTRTWNVVALATAS